MEEASTTDAANNNDNGDCGVVAVEIHNAAVVQVPFPPLCLPVSIPYVGEPPSTIALTVPVAKILGGQTSNSSIFHDVQDIRTVQPLNYHTLPP